MLDILGKRYYFFAFSLLLIIPGMILLMTKGLPLAIDFTGGSLLEVSFDSGTAPASADIIALYEDMGITDVTVQPSEDGIVNIKSTEIDEDIRGKIVSAMEERFNDTITIRSFDTVGPSVGKEVAVQGLKAVAVAALAVVIYITFAFRGIPHAFRYAVCAIIAMLHDILVVLSISTIGGNFLGWQIDSLFLTALLTVIGFSVQDKIVVFDRIRENTNIYRRISFEKLVNHSIVQTLQRSINTQLMTVEFMLLALALFGGVTLREFSVILLIGLFMGTYSSIFIAASSLVLWENREWKTWFGRGKNEATIG